MRGHHLILAVFTSPTLLVLNFYWPPHSARAWGIFIFAEIKALISMDKVLGIIHLSGDPRELDQWPRPGGDLDQMEQLRV